MSKLSNFLGPFRLARLIRMGSTCQVWEAIQTQEHKRYALKVLRPDQRGNKTEIGYLKHEFDVASQFKHKNLIKVYDFITDIDTPFLVLELFSELNLKQALRQGTSSIAYMADSVLEQLVESLNYLHSKNWIHCDVKPDNFLISREGEIRLIDFTISQRAASGLTKFFKIKNRNIAGTRSYMSPEQIRGLPLDARSDIYSLGCVFYEVAAGKPPFTGESPNDLLNKHIAAAIPSPAVADDAVSPEFCDLIRTMMAKKPDNRPATMYDVWKLLRGIKVYKRPQRIPDRLIFDDFPMAGRVSTPDQIEGEVREAMQTPAEPEVENDENGSGKSEE